MHQAYEPSQSDFYDIEIFFFLSCILFDEGIFTPFSLLLLCGL